MSRIGRSSVFIVRRKPGVSVDSGEAALQPDVPRVEEEIPDRTAHAERVAALFTTHHAKLVHSLIPKTGSYDEACDIASQAFAEVLAVDQPGRVSFLAGYVYRTARNILQNQWKSRQVRRRHAAIAAYEPDLSVSSPEPTWVGLEQMQLVRQAMDRLPPRCYNVLVLRLWHSLTYEEIVARLAEDGIYVTTRTVEREFAKAIELCGKELKAAEGARARGQA
jgi:RNA polymerase sigma factor (sigma-70 family)